MLQWMMRSSKRLRRTQPNPRAPLDLIALEMWATRQPRGRQAYLAYNLRMPGKANVKRRKRAATGRRRAAPQQELALERKAAEEKESAEFLDLLEVRSRIAESGGKMLRSNDDLDRLFENREL
jgi:hypothetical protein